LNCKYLRKLRVPTISLTKLRIIRDIANNKIHTMVLLDSQWFILVASLLGGYAFVFGFIRRLNEWYYVRRLGKLPLPPGDMGWPFLGNMPTFLKAFKSDPDSFINNLISRYYSQSIS
jgi:ent-kaurenoic acid hydroxylase